MIEKKVIPVKYFYYGMIGCVIFISGFFFLLWLSESSKHEKLNEKGITVNGWVVELSESKASKKSTPSYYMKVAFFKDTTLKIPNETPDTIAKNITNGDELVAAIAKQTAIVNQPLGDYETQTITLPGYEVYKKYNINDKVKVQFLPEDHSVIRLVNR
jgi:hypothetical protein